MTESLRLCAVADLAPGQFQRFEPAGRDPVLLCNVDGSFYAVDDECTHAIADLSEGRMEGEIVFCPMHGGSFNVRSGKACSLPCKQALRTYVVELADGAVWLKL
jgi:nitrite reductase/ring-hydroxylating ferredoxin subunit